MNTLMEFIEDFYVELDSARSNLTDEFVQSLTCQFVDYANVLASDVRSFFENEAERQYYASIETA